MSEEIIEYEEDIVEDLELAYLKDDDMQSITKESSEKQKTTLNENESQTAELEQVMTSGMQFLSGLFKMSTGKDVGLENQQIKINKETGEVTMTFKLPV